MNRVRKKLLQLSFLFTILVAGACNDPDEVGLGVQPEGNQPGVITIDVDSFTTYTVLEDSLVSSSTLSPLFLGTLYDIETGITAASFYAQVRLGGLITSSTFNDFTSADSVILSLGYIKNGIYGDTLSQHSISVYELNEALSTDSVYYSNRDFSLKSMIGHTEVVPRVNDSVPQMRIQLDNGFANDLVNRLKSTTPDNATLVKDVFKGIYVIDSVSGTGSVVNLLSTSTINRLIIYYNDSLTFEMEINSASARSLRFKHDYCLGLTNQQICLNNKAAGQFTTYVQSLAGLKTKIILPDWNQVFANKKVSVSRADIVLNIKSGSDAAPLLPHETLLLLAADSLGKNTLTADFLDLGGTYNSTDKQYKLNFTRQLQQILNGTVKDYGLYIVSGGSTSNARRTVLNGGNTMKLSITYTQQNN